MRTALTVIRAKPFLMEPREMRKARFTCLMLAVTLLVLSITVACGQESAPTGRFKVNGHRLYLTCMGKGEPVVVLDAGLGGDHTGWPQVVRRASALHT
jgi:hypothetical protein